MKPPPIRLYGPKQIVLASVALIAGIGLSLARRYYETGRLGWTELFAALVTLALSVMIFIVIVRRGNQSD